MSTIVPASHATTAGLVEGEHLEQPEFHRRYEATPPKFRAELIDGVVFRHGRIGIVHGDSSAACIYCLGLYKMGTRGVRSLGSTTLILGPRSELQPDASLLIRPEFGGQSSEAGGFIRGAPELVVEIADKATRYVDLGPKLADYGRAGVQEYVVRALDPDEVLWFRHVDGSLKRVVPDADGLYRSVVFPGLWLDPVALLAGDLPRLEQVVGQGLATPEHAAFVARLAANRATTA